MYDISLVIPTYGRIKELEELFISLMRQDYDMSRVEIIVADQNDKIDLAPMLQRYSEKLVILHEKLNIKGIAHSKNHGLRIARAEIVTFPDDDCLYYPDTISVAMRAMNEYADATVVYGRIYDRVRRKNVMRNWKSTPIKLDKLNFHLNYSAITCFTRDKTLLFDERFGVGSKFGVGEELDYIMQLMKRNKIVYYLPQIDIWHPEPGVKTMTPEKTLYYAEGYGATFRKNPLLPFLFIFLSSCFYQFGLFALEGMRGNREMATKRWLAFKGRIIGFRKFNCNES